MMTAHGIYPALDPGGAPAVMSRELLQWLLRQQLRYDGVVVGDVSTLPAAYGDEGEAAVRAIAAGCDVLLVSERLSEVAATLERALAEQRLDPERVRQSHRRRLKWAQWAAPPNDWRRPTASDAAWGAQLADRVVHVARGEPAPPMGQVEVMAVDDDALRDPGHAPRGVDAILDTLRTAGVAARRLDAPADVIGGTLLVALFGDAREGYSDATRDLVADLWADSVVRGRQDRKSTRLNSSHLV